MEANSERTRPILPPIQVVFDVCLAAMQTGVPLEDCLRLYPGLEAELRPMLLAAQAAKKLAVTAVPQPAANRSRAQMLARAAQLRSKRAAPSTFRIPRWALAALALVLVLTFSLNGLVGASARTLPGDRLYPVKIAAENVRLQLVSSVESKHEMEVAYSHRRAEEVNELLLMKRSERISLEGAVSSISPDRWVVEGIPVVLTPNTKIIGNIRLGQVVEVDGYTEPAGWVVADELHLRYYKATGIVEAIENDRWQVGGVEYGLLSSTQIDPALDLGDSALVLVYSSDNGKLYAQALLNRTGLWAQFEPFEIEFSGLLEAVTGDQFTIAGKTVATGSQTEFQGNLSPGKEVRVRAVLNADGSLSAVFISMLAPSQDNSLIGKPAPQTPASSGDDSHDAQSLDSDDDLAGSETEVSEEDDGSVGDQAEDQEDDAAEDHEDGNASRDGDDEDDDQEDSDSDSQDNEDEDQEDGDDGEQDDSSEDHKDGDDGEKDSSDSKESNVESR